MNGNQQLKTDATLNFRQIAAQLNKLCELNDNLRVKYPNEQEKFLQSEKGINSIIESLENINDNQIIDLMESKILIPVLKTLWHPNTDINISVINIVHQLVCQEPNNDQYYEEYFKMCLWMCENNLLEGLVESLFKLDEQHNLQQYESILQILKIIESLLELSKKVCLILVSDTRIMEYLANRIMPNFEVTHKIIDDNKYVSSDLLMILLQTSQQAQLKFNSMQGMEILLQSIKYYENKLPSNTDQGEHLCNLLDLINILLINQTEKQHSKQIYHSMQGNCLMLYYLKTKTSYSIPAFKVMSNSIFKLHTNLNGDVVHILIQLGILKYLFPMLIQQGIRGQDVDQQRMLDQYLLNLIFTFVHYAKDVELDRVIYKLIEKRFSKLERLFQMRNQYMHNIVQHHTESNITQQEYIDALKDGLINLQLIDKTILTLVSYDKPQIHAKIINFMELYGVQLKDFTQILNNHYLFLADSPEKQIVAKLITKNLNLLSQMKNSMNLF